MRAVEYRNLLDEDVALRVRFVIERNYVEEFVVQLECLVEAAWHAVVRYDTAHGFTHRDVIHPSGTTLKTKLAIEDYNQALTFAIKDLTTNWVMYRRRYRQWMRSE